MKKSALTLYILLTSLITHSQSFLSESNTMEKFKLFNFSQHWNLTIPDTQVFHTLPDMIIRGWCQWKNWGTLPTDFNFNVVTQYHQKNICFIGGVTASVYFFDQAKDSAQFKDMVTRDAYNNLVPHNILGQGAYRGNIANPAYRDYLFNLSKIQIDGGVDGMFFDEVISGYIGLKYDGNEGFDDYCLKDFNQYLASKYPDYTKADWIKKFKMTNDNYINTAYPLNDLNKNFNYRKYLETNNWQSNPLKNDNPLAREWGNVINNRADTSSDSFLSKYTTIYWKDIVTRIRQYAREKFNKEILITANGIFPYVDFNSLGMYNGNHDNNGAEAKYVPVLSGHLDGSVSLQNVFKNLYQTSKNLSGSVPVILFIDWPTQTLTDYYKLPLNEKMDYWRIYAAEAYANGLVIAFHLRTSMPDDPTAEEQGMLDFIKTYPEFYKENASIYHHKEIIEPNFKISEKGINYSVMRCRDTGRYTIHLVNHNYNNEAGMTAKYDLSISFSYDKDPKKVYIISPDFEGIHDLEWHFNNGILNLNVDKLLYYDLIEVE